MFHLIDVYIIVEMKREQAEKLRARRRDYTSVMVLIKCWMIPIICLSSLMDVTSGGMMLVSSYSDWRYVTELCRYLLSGFAIL